MKQISQQSCRLLSGDDSVGLRAVAADGKRGFMCTTRHP